MCVYRRKREFPGIFLLENREGAVLGAEESNGLTSVAKAR